MRFGSDDRPIVEPPDTLEIEVVEHPFSFRRSDDKELNALIVEAVNRMGGMGDDAEERYQRALEDLKKRAEEVVGVVAAEYRDLPEESYLDRWSLVHLLAELRHPAALGILEDILSSEIPPERSPDPHGFSTAGEEVMIRTTAVEALVRLSGEGVQDARELLLKYAEHPNFSVRRACVQGVMETGRDEDQERLRETLKRAGEDRLLTIERVDVRKVPQATGGRFLVHPETKGEPPPHDLRGKREV
jgi:hypothetical protein